MRGGGEWCEWVEKERNGEGGWRERVRYFTKFSTYIPHLCQDSTDTEGSTSDTSLKLFPGAARRHGRLLASPPMCVPEVQEKTHVKK